MNIIDYIALIMPVFLIIGGYVAYRCEKNVWNNGICKISENKWERFDCDSQGGRGYKDNNGNYCWISWRRIDN